VHLFAEDHIRSIEMAVKGPCSSQMIQHVPRAESHANIA